MAHSDILAEIQGIKYERDLANATVLTPELTLDDDVITTISSCCQC
jgi:hypothetical protein